eukprot:scaffold210929_cov13-Tisochrysis_lutea.AAC.1
MMQTDGAAAKDGNKLDNTKISCRKYARQRELLKSVVEESIQSGMIDLLHTAAGGLGFFANLFWHLVQ